MDLEVLVQGVPLGEAAVTLLTLIGPGARVDVGVVPQVLLGRKALPTRLAHEGLLSCEEEDDDGGGKYLIPSSRKKVRTHAENNGIYMTTQTRRE